MSGESDNKIDVSKLSTEDLAKLFQRPEVLNMAVETAKTAGILKDPVSKTEVIEKKTFDLKAPEMPDISKLEDNADVSKAIAKYTQDLNEFHTKQREWDKKDIEDGIKQTNNDTRAREVNKFANDPKRLKNFQNKAVYADIDRFFSTGDDIESAYKKALKLHDIVEDSEGKDKESGEGGESKPKISNLSTSQNGRPAPKTTDSGRESTPPKTSLSSQIDVKGASERALDKLAKANPDILKDLE